MGYTERAMSAGGQRQIELGRKIVRAGAGSGLSCLALALLLGGCGGGEAEPVRGRGDRTTEDPARERATSASDEVIDDAALASALTGASGPTETVVIAVRTLPEGLDPLAEMDPWGARACEDLLFEGLVRRWPEGHPWIEPALADRCEAGQGGREVLCHLRADRRFHDGEPVSVEDVLYSLSAWTGPKGAQRRAAHGLGALQEVSAVDGPASARDPGRWIRLTFDAADPLVLERIAAMKVVPRARHRGKATAFAREPIGSGPMRLVSADEARMIFERHEDAAPERTGARRIVLQVAPDGAQALTLLRRGEVHVVAEVSPVHVPRELGKPGMAARFRGYVVSPPRYDLLVFNLRGGAQSGPRLREALARAIPWARLAEIYGRPSLRAAAPVDEHAPTPIDLAAITAGRLSDAGLALWLTTPDPAADEAGRAEAAAILDALGWTLDRGLRRRSTGNLRLALTWDGSGGLASDLVAAIKGGWRELGVQVPSVTASWSYLQRPLAAGEFDLALLRFADHSDADLYDLFHSRGRLNYAGVVDPTLNAAIEGYREARTPAERRSAKAAMAARLRELQPVTVLHAPLAITLVSRRITDLVFVDDLPRLDRLGLGGEASEGLLEQATE